MKKIIFISFLGFALTTNAQSKTKYGLSTGVNISNLSGLDANGFSSKTGFRFGGFLQNYLSDKISIDAELHYMQMGAKFNTNITSPIGNFSVSGKINNDYLRLPILFDYHPTQEFSIALGTELGFLIKNKVAFDQLINGSSSTNPKNTEQFDAGIKAKVQYILGNRYLASIDYYSGFTKVFKNTEVYTQNSLILQDAPKIYNSNFGISLGYIF